MELTDFLQTIKGDTGAERIETNVHNVSEKLPERVSWNSPIFGELSGGPVLEMGETTFTLKHPLTGEIVNLSKKWLVSMDERSSILEFDGGLPRESADRAARIEFFGLFREGGKP